MKPPRYSLSAPLTKAKELLFNLKNKSQKVRKGKQRGELKGFLFPAGGFVWNEKKNERHEKQKANDAA